MLPLQSRSLVPKRAAADSDDSYDSEDGGSRSSKYACFAFMFDKAGCAKGGKCTYSHKSRVIETYKRDKEKAKKSGDDRGAVSRSAPKPERGGSSRDDEKSSKKSEKKSEKKPRPSSDSGSDSDSSVAKPKRSSSRK